MNLGKMYVTAVCKLISGAYEVTHVNIGYCCACSGQSAIVHGES